MQFALPFAGAKPFATRSARSCETGDGLEVDFEDNPMKHILALDQGTTSSRAIVFAADGRVVSRAQREITQIYPQPGWVEHDANEILSTQLQTAREALSGVIGEVSAIGITNQRETVVLWERATGKPVHNAVVWQDRRTAGLCDDLKAQGLEAAWRAKTGLLIDPYFSGTKLSWLLEHVPGTRDRAERGELLFGTVDAWLVWNLTNGATHATDATNAARTLLFDIHRQTWDDEILEVLKIPRAVLPEVRASSAMYGHAASLGGLPILGVAGDQHAALFGQACLQPGMAKNTYGTGCFMLLNTGAHAVSSASGLLTTPAWALNGNVTYALEGSVFIAGAVVQWLRDELKFFTDAREVETLAASVPDNAGVYLVPAFAGLGAPHWDAYARGTIVGLTRGTGRTHIARAALEAIAYQVRDVLEAMQRDSGVRLAALRVDGGATANDLLMQFQADLLGVPVERPVVTETTALGAAYLAGIEAGVFTVDGIGSHWRLERRFEPRMDAATRDRLYAGWQRATQRAKGWLEG
jgi:glycerol kinase